MAKTDIRILVKEKASGDYVMVDTMEYDDYVDLVYDTTDDDKPLAVLDTVEALGRYINAASITVYDWDGGAKAGALRTVAGLDGEVEADDFVYPRINLVNKDGAYGNDLTDCTVEFGFPCIEPLRGAQDGHQGIPGTYIRGTADAPAASGSF